MAIRIININHIVIIHTINDWLIAPMESMEGELLFARARRNTTKILVQSQYNCTEQVAS